MPIYEFKCECGRRKDKLLKLEEYATPQHCECGALMTKQFSAPAVRGDFQPYNCPITGKLIDGRRQHRENLARHGCRVLETGETAQAKRFAQQQDAALDKAVDATTEAFMANLPARKAEQLVAEIQSGVTAEIVRS